MGHVIVFYTGEPVKASCGSIHRLSLPSNETVYCDLMDTKMNNYMLLIMVITISCIMSNLTYT